MRRTPILLLGILAAVLAGCGGILPKPAAAPDLYTLSPATAPAAPAAPRGVTQIMIDVVLAPAALDSARIALHHTPTNVEYYADSAWSDRAPALVQQLMLDTVGRSGQFVAVSRDAVVLHPDNLLIGQLKHFEADYRGTGAPTVQFEIDLKLVRAADGVILAQRNFTASQPAAANNVPAVVTAFDDAAHAALKDLPAWIAASLSLRQLPAPRPPARR